MADTQKQTVGLGTTAQIVVAMEPLDNYTLADLEWTIEFQGDSGSCIVPKSSAIAQGDGTYLCLVDTTKTGKSKDVTARLKVTGIPVPNTTTQRNEVTPSVNVGLEVV